MRKAVPESVAAPLAAEKQIDRVCDGFEAELKAGRRPDLSRILDQVPTGLREALLVELVLVGLEFTGTSANHKSWSDSTKADRPPQRLKSNAPTSDRADLSHGAESLCNSASRPAFPPRTIGGYELLNELGRGGMGVVYRARQLAADRVVALKIIRGSRFENTDDARAVLMERFRTEAKAASRLDHENIATVYDVGQFGDDPYYAMRLVEGPSLGKLVEAGPLPAGRVVRYLLPIARTIARLHSAGVVHRDLKPSNILIEVSSDTPILTDFGLAKLIDAQQNVTLSDEGIGSPPYMAPEQVLHATSVTGAADIYSLGATLYHLLTGRPPFQADNLPEIARQIVFCDPVAPRQLNSSIERDLETICLKCLEKDESRRYATANDLANDLRCFLDRRPIVARPIGNAGRIWRWGRRNPAWVTFAISSIVVLSASAVTLTVMYTRERLASAIAKTALEDNRLKLSKELFDKSLFTQGENPLRSLPWLVGCLRLDVGTPREPATRQRIHSVLSHGPDLAQTFSHDGPISCAAFHPNGDCVLTGSTDRTARIWSTKTGNCLNVFRHEARVRQALFNHRGDGAATAADDGTVQLWSLEFGQKLGTALIHPGYVNCAVFSADDEFLVTASADERVRVWRTRDGNLQTAIVAGKPGSPISVVAISPDGSRGVSCSGTSRALVWSLTNAELNSFELEHSDVVTTAQFSPNGAAIVTAGADGKAKIWDVVSGRLLFECTHSSAVKQVCFTADSKRVVTATDKAAFVWSLEAAQPKAFTLVHDGLKNIAVDPTNTALLTVGNDRTVRLWNVQNGKPLGDPYYYAGDSAGAQFSFDGSSVLTCSADGTARIWNRRDRLQKCRIADVPSVSIVKATPDSQWILALGDAGIGNVFRANGTDMGDAVFKHDEKITAVCISSDGQRVAAAGTKGNIVVWNRETDHSLKQPSRHDHVIRAVAFAPDNRTLATGDAQGNVNVCTVETGESLTSFRLSSEVIEVAFGAGGDLFLTADRKAARLARLDPNGLSDIKSIELGGDILGARFSPDGNYIVIYGAANRVVVWDVAGGLPKTLHTTSAVNNACFTCNSSKLLTVAQDGTAQIWRLIDGSPMHEPLRHAAPLVMGAFSPDGQSVALCGADATVRVWQAEVGQPVTIPLRHTGRIMHAQFVTARQLLTVTEHGEIHVFDIVPAATGIEELERMSKIRSGEHVDADGVLTHLSRPELVRLCRETHDRSGD